jgi:ubiquitin-protein ligase
MNAAGEGGTRALMNRLMKEVQLLREDPPPGVAAWPVSEMDITKFEARESNAT